MASPEAVSADIVLTPNAEAGPVETHEPGSDAMKGRGLPPSCVPGGCWGCTHVDDEGGPSCQSTQGVSLSVWIYIAGAV